MKNKIKYKCNKCGYETVSWIGKCPSCNSWGSLKEISILGSTEDKRRSSVEHKAETLKEVAIDRSERINTNISELNRVLGGGLIRDSVTILTARPGAGKSTLFLEICNKLNADVKILYVSGEESKSQIKSRALRIMDQISDNIYILSTTSMDIALESIEQLNPQLILLDSIQTFSLREYPSRPGSPVQTIECTNRLVEAAKDARNPKAVIMIGHMTKSDEMAGLRTLEHLVDTVLYMEGESDEPLRVLLSTKNRFGRTGEIGLFHMDETGLKEITDSSEYFVTKRDKEIPGSCLSIIKEGSRMLVVEIESLVSKSFLPYPTRIGDSLRKDQLNTLVSILEERANINLSDRNVILKTTGGLKLSEQSVDLAIIMSIVSSVLKKGISSSTAFIAEVGLTGELKKVSQLEKRVDELERLGYQKVFCPKQHIHASERKIQVVALSTINEVIQQVFY